MLDSSLSFFPCEELQGRSGLALHWSVHATLGREREEGHQGVLRDIKVCSEMLVLPQQMACGPGVAPGVATSQLVLVATSACHGRLCVARVWHGCGTGVATSPTSACHSRLGVARVPPQVWQQML